VKARPTAPLVAAAAALFAVLGAARAVAVGDLLALAHLSVAAGLTLFALREGAPHLAPRLWYAPEFVLLLGILQYAYHAIGV
jgi:uncharacterized membrane protein